MRILKRIKTLWQISGMDLGKDLKLKDKIDNFIHPKRAKIVELEDDFDKALKENDIK